MGTQGFGVSFLVCENVGFCEWTFYIELGLFGIEDGDSHGFSVHTDQMTRF